jgi:Na+-transporting methylmalonyl-CoA/oxaloacetate decarboxylase gamma subunit
LLLSPGILGFIVELQTPGFSLPGILGVTSLALFFWGHWLVQLAGWEELRLVGIGFVLLVVLAFILLISFATRVLRRWVQGDVPWGMEPEAPQSPQRGPRPPLPVAQPRRVREGPQGTPLLVAVAPSAARRRSRSRLRSPRGRYAAAPCS